MAFTALWPYQRKKYFILAFVAACGPLQTHFHERGRRDKQHLLLSALRPKRSESAKA